jgi:cytochrome P450
VGPARGAAASRCRADPGWAGAPPTASPAREAFKAAELQGYQRIFQQDVTRHVDAWEGQIDLFQEAKRLSFDIAASTFMGLPLGDDADQALRWFGQIAGGLVAVSYNPWLSPARLRGLAAKARLEEMLCGMVRNRRRSPGTDFLSRLSMQVDDDGSLMPEQEVLDAIIFLLVAAHDTMSSALTSCIWFLAREPGWSSELRAELKASGIDSGAQAGLARLPLMSMFFKEAVRLNPPAPVVWRRALREVILCGHRVPAGTMVGTNLTVSHRLPESGPSRIASTRCGSRPMRRRRGIASHMLRSVRGCINASGCTSHNNRRRR